MSNPFIPSSLHVSRRTTENCVAQQGLLRLSSGDATVKRTADVVDDEMRDLRQRASLLHHRQMLIYNPSEARAQKVHDLTAEVEGSTWNMLRQLKSENTTLKAQSASQATARHAAALSPRGRSPRAPVYGNAELQVEEVLQRQVAQLQAENARLRSKMEQAPS